MTSKTFKIETDGLNELRSAFRRLGRGGNKEIKEFTIAAATLIVKKGRPMVPRRRGKARRSWAVSSDAKGAKVTYGGPTAPYMSWLDFGGRVGRRKSVLRPYIPSGRYLYPTVGKYQKQIRAMADETLAEMAENSGLKVD